MSKPRSRSREFNRNSNVVDFDKARQQRREKRRRAAEKTVEIMEQAPERRYQKNRSRKRVIIALIILLVAGAVALSPVNIVRLEKQKHELVKQQEELKETLSSKQKELENVNDPEYIEKQVREKLNMVYPDEILYMSPDEEKRSDDN